MIDAEQQQLDGLVALALESLRSDLVGAYLFGSAVLGGLRPASDLDVLAVTTRSITRDEKQRLVDGLLALSGRPRHLELTVVAYPEISPWRYPPRMELQYGDWWRTEFESGNLEPWGDPVNPDLTILLAMAVAANRPLLGPPPGELFDWVPRDDLARSMTDSIEPILLDLDGDTRNVVLTLARIWCSLETGEIRPKDAAADWALDRLPDEHRPVLARARGIYVGEENERWDDLGSRVRPHTEHVVAAIAGLSDS